MVMSMFATLSAGAGPVLGGPVRTTPARSDGAGLQPRFFEHDFWLLKKSRKLARRIEHDDFSTRARFEHDFFSAASTIFLALQLVLQ